MDFHQQITLRRLQFTEADLQVSTTNLLNIFSTGLFGQHIPNIIGKNQWAASHSTSMLQRLKPSYREQPTAKRGAFCKIIELPPGNQTRFLRDFFDIMPCRKQSSQKRTNARLVFHQESYKGFVTLAVIRRRQIFNRFIIQNHTTLLRPTILLPPVGNLDRHFPKKPVHHRFRFQAWRKFGCPDSTFSGADIQSNPYLSGLFPLRSGLSGYWILVQGPSR